MKPEQPDLFEWADNRKSAEIISIIPPLAAKIRWEIKMGIADNPPWYDGDVLPFRVKRAAGR